MPDNLDSNTPVGLTAAYHKPTEAELDIEFWRETYFTCLRNCTSVSEAIVSANEGLRAYRGLRSTSR